jgi:hypothetical protein
VAKGVLVAKDSDRLDRRFGRKSGNRRLLFQYVLHDIMFHAKSQERGRENALRTFRKGGGHCEGFFNALPQTSEHAALTARLHDGE